MFILGRVMGFYLFAAFKTGSRELRRLKYSESRGTTLPLPSLELICNIMPKGVNIMN
jgi:hypothetical protein